jgi:Domain of Unknown Function with PDB structure (DUF3857)/Transglutaminase-like superfamily
MLPTASKYLSFAFLMTLSVARSGASVMVPHWVSEAAKTPTGTYSLEATAIVLLNDTDVTVLDSGDYIEHSREVLKVLRPDWRADRDLAVSLHSGEKINSIHAWTIDASGRQFELKDKDCVEAAPFSYELYSDIHWRACPSAAPYPGSVVAFEYEVHRHPWFPEISFLLQDASPVIQESISLSLPAGWEYKDSWTETNAPQVSQIGPNQWKWAISGLPAIDKEPQMPAVVVLAPKLDIAYFRPGQRGALGSWNEIGRWYSTLTAQRRVLAPDIETKANALTQSKVDFDAKVRAITEFIQSEIRYVAIEIGIGGYQPHAAAEVFRERYGDCKDKVTLLSAMLQAANIRADYVIINTHRGLVHPKLPSTTSFNHVISAIEIPGEADTSRYQAVIAASSGKHYIIFDPTDEYTPVGSLRSELQNTFALLVTDSGGELIRTPLLEPDANKIVRSGHFVLSAEGDLWGEVNEARSGDFATEERYRLRYRDQQQQARDLEHWLGGSLQGFTLNALRVEGAEQRETNLNLRYDLAVRRYAQEQGTLMLIRPSILKRRGVLIEKTVRRYPLELGDIGRQTDVYEIEIPLEYRVDDSPDAVNIDVGFASYKSKIAVEGEKLRYWREYVVRDLSVPPEKFNDWTRLQGAIGADESAAVVLKRSQ